MSWSVTTSKLKENIISGKALAVNNDSYYLLTEVGACAWTISTPDGKKRIQGGGVIPGPKKIKSVTGPLLRVGKTTPPPTSKGGANQKKS